LTGEQIKATRLELGQTLEQTASLLSYGGVGLRQQMHNLEAGRRTIREAQRRLVEAYLAGYRPLDWPADN
jgi:hypothetical protein